jgi:DNA-directed RNA polymerase specialized sigma24 family protein
MTAVHMLGERELVIDEERAAERLDFQRVYYRTWPDVFRYALTLLRHREDAEDLAAEAFRWALESWDSGRGPSETSCPGSS